MEQAEAFDALVVDITRSVTRFALGLGRERSGGTPVLGHYLKVQTSEFSSIVPLIRRYLDTLEEGMPLPSVLAISHAGPVIGGKIIIPGCALSFSLEEIRAAFDFREIVHANDCVAMGSALPWLGDDDIGNVGSTEQTTFRQQPGRYGLVVPTWGLGVASIIHNGETMQVIDSEGGHANFAPPCEWLGGMLQDHHKRGRSLSFGDVVSQPGLENIYAYIAARNDTPPSDLRAQEILLYARNEADPACLDAIRYFSRALGAWAGDVALMLGAVDGVFLVSPFVNEVLDFGDEIEQLIREFFEAKTEFRLYMQGIPLYNITHRRASMIGALRMACEKAAIPVPA